MKQRRRKLSLSHGRDAQEISAAQYDVNVGAQKNYEVGKLLRPLGDLATAKSANPGATIYCYNEDTATHWVKTGASAVAAPTGSANGIPIPPTSYFAVATGMDSFIRSDSNKVFGFLLYDDSELVEEGQD